MKPFCFRGARLLDWRRASADAARRRLARDQEAARETAKLVAQADARRDTAMHEYREAFSATTEAGSLERHRTWIDRQRREALTCHQTHQERRDAVGRSAEIFRLANQKVRVMERLRDRAWGRYMIASRRAETKELDELATLRHARRRMEGGSDRER